MDCKVHNFQKYLKTSHSFQALPFWKGIYEKFFGEGVTIISHSQNGVHQQLGIDRSVVMTDSRIYRIEEKVDYHANRNIFIEYWSDWEKRVPGWIVKPLYCDYVVYVIPAMGEAYFFNTLVLQDIWKDIGNQWIGQYHEKRIRNHSGSREWTTIGTPVPVNDVYKQYKLRHRVLFPAFVLGE